VRFAEVPISLREGSEKRLTAKRDHTGAPGSPNHTAFRMRVPPSVEGYIIVYTMAVTMKDIARELGVSVVTVSRSFATTVTLEKRPRQRVAQNAIKELNYEPNMAARALVRPTMRPD